MLMHERPGPALRLQIALQSLEVRQRAFTLGRGALAAAQISILVFTPFSALMQTVGGAEPAPYCAGARIISAFCIGGPEVPSIVRVIVMIVLLGLVLVGFLPRVMAFVHAWISISISTGISLPDGGDSVAAIVSVIIIFIMAADDRRWAWSKERRPVGPVGRGVALAGIYALRLQVTLIYLNSAFEKFNVDDWSNGSAEYYISRGYMFGASGLIADVLHWATSVPLLLAVITWGVIVAEICIGILVVTIDFGRRIAFILAVALHVGIILSIGLWSFGIIMIATVGIATMKLVPSSASPGSASDEDDSPSILGDDDAARRSEVL
ncbi:hypothetical protein C5D34_11985 [Rathayibacter sp. AY1B1]|nr:hypothetical protein C5D08_01290 [Rathayibacter sp. AY1B6]PPI32012.1 hypothetical protein C5D34_11985 [Rathayibacter sp. AY1B1]